MHSLKSLKTNLHFLTFENLQVKVWPKVSHLNVAKKKRKMFIGKTSLEFPGSKKESWLLRTFENSLISYPITLSVGSLFWRV